MLSWVDLLSVSVTFPDHTHFMYKFNFSNPWGHCPKEVLLLFCCIVVYAGQRIVRNPRHLPIISHLHIIEPFNLRHVLCTLYLCTLDESTVLTHFVIFAEITIFVTLLIQRILLVIISICGA